MSTIIVIGSGGHARSLLGLLARLRLDVAGLVSADSVAIGAHVVLGDDDWLERHGSTGVQLVNGIGSAGPTTVRRKVFDRFAAVGFGFITLVDPHADHDRDLEIGEGSQILKGALIQPNVQLGRNVIINTGTIIEHDCVVGDHAHVATGCVLTGGVVVESGAHVGAGSVVRQGIRIGRDAVVGAGSVVTKDVPDGSVVFGCPARIVED